MLNKINLKFVLQLNGGLKLGFALKQFSQYSKIFLFSAQKVK